MVKVAQNQVEVYEDISITIFLLHFRVFTEMIEQLDDNQELQEVALFICGC